LPLAAGFLSLTWWLDGIFDECGILVLAAVSRGFWKRVDHLETKNPACFSGEQGSRKSMIYGEIVNYLPASLVRF
jgi:hypothetical protein